MTPSPPPITSCPGRRRAVPTTAMPSSSFLGASPSSSASSPLSYLIPARPPPLLMQGQGYGVNNGVGGSMPASSGVTDVASSAVMAPPPRPAAAGRTGHQPLPRPPPRQCPRCGSGNTKFCYYNNYSRSQPRYLCKACRRHWTEGGTLRDVPVGRGRKARRGSKATAAATKASSSSSSSATALPIGSSADVAFPDILRQVLFQPVGTMGGGGGYGIDLGAWQQMVDATAPPQGTGDAGALGGTTMDGNCSALQYWSGWQQDDAPGLDGAC